MININTLQTKILVTGDIDIKVYDTEDLRRMEPKVSIEDHNTTGTFLMGEFIDQMHSSSGNTSYHINTASNWFTQRYPGEDSNANVTEQDGKDGILAISTVSTGYIDSASGNGTELLHMFFLHQNKSTSNVNNASEWTAESVWNLATTTITSFEIGKDLMTNSQDPTGTFEDDVATYNVPDFSMQSSDILRVTWTITVG
jgi:hypothetical protein